MPNQILGTVRLKFAFHTDIHHMLAPIHQQEFLVMDLHDDNMILGYPFLLTTNPSIDWQDGKLHGRLLAWTMQNFPLGLIVDCLLRRSTISKSNNEDTHKG